MTADWGMIAETVTILIGTQSSDEFGSVSQSKSALAYPMDATRLEGKCTYLGLPSQALEAHFSMVSRFSGEGLDGWCHDKSRNHQDQALGPFKHHLRTEWTEGMLGEQEAG